MKSVTLLFVLIVIIFSFSFFLWKEEVYRVLEVIELPKKETVSVLSFGDIMLDRGVRNIIDKGRDPFEYVKKEGEFIKDFDVVIANLEGPIVEMPRANCQQKAYNFQFASNTPERLKSVGITMVTIANNHSNDCYKKGRDSTKQYLETAGIEYIGDAGVDKSFVVKIIHDKKVAFVGMDQTISPASISLYYPLIKKLNIENDYVIVHIHWGTEYELNPTDVQKKIAHALVDNGADVVFGHHPHVPEPVEVYKGKVIFYSLGNFVFDQTGEFQTQGYGAGVEFGEKENIFTLFPYKIKSFAPDFLEGKEKDVFCNAYVKGQNISECTFSVPSIPIVE